LPLSERWLLGSLGGATDMPLSDEVEKKISATQKVRYERLRRGAEALKIVEALGLGK
jgi:hypothetical protein